jgi:two-component system NarL family sensor kinase
LCAFKSLEQLGSELAAESLGAWRRTQEIRDQVARIAADLHALSHQLHPALLEDLGLEKALGRLCRTMSEQHQLDVRFAVRDAHHVFTPEVSLCVFRIAQEALRSVVKHSGASVAAVELTGRADSVELRVSDTGVGFEPAARPHAPGIGLISIRERLRPLGGRLRVRSAPSEGATIVARVPAPRIERK